MGLFGKSKKQLEKENQLLKQMLVTTASKSSNSKKEKQVVWQCRYCGIKSTRWQSNGMPEPGFCSKNGKIGGPKGPHRWVKIMTK